MRVLLKSLICIYICRSCTINAFNIDDIRMVYDVDDISDSLLHLASHHDTKISHISSNFFLLCGPYSSSLSITRLLQSSLAINAYQPIYSSRNKNRVCHVVSNNDDDLGDTFAHISGVSTTKIPHIIKLHRSVEWVIREIDSAKAESVVLELDVGAFHDQEISHAEIFSELQHMAGSICRDQIMRRLHENMFFWSRQIDNKHAVNLRTGDNSRAETLRTQYADAFSHTCDFSTMMFQSQHSHMLLFLTTKIASRTLSDCVRILASAASLRSDVRHVSAHLPPVLLSHSSLTDYYSEDYSTAPAATDQNAFVQTGTSTQTPYSDMGLDGSGYVLGMIDSGIDDLSCFLIETDGSETPRTLKEDYTSPITESYRRKVIQYVAWADKIPREGRDHGTWCGGASVGRCFNSTSPARQYNGLASNAKITMFDVDANGNWLDVPSLYDISLPPAYSAGARVHSNSWGTPGMGSYTSKALDVDRFMVDNPDFLFVVAAGNDGRSGYTR